MSILKDFFTKNILLKISSLAIAIILWLIAINVNNPPITASYSLPLEFLNSDNLLLNNFIILNEKKIKDSKIDVLVEATRNDLKFINQNPDNLKAIINFKDVDISYEKYVGSNLIMPVNISFSSYLNSSHYQITNVYPSKVDVQLDNFIIDNEQVYYDTDGEPAKNYYIQEIIIQPESIKISGAQSILETIKPITLNLSTIGATKNIITKMPIKIFDKNDNEVTDNLILDNKQVNVLIKIDSYNIIPIEKPETTGKIADGYKIKNIDYEPKEIKITGSSKFDLEAIKLPPIDIDQASLSKQITINLHDILDDNIEIVKNETDKISITINIEKIN